MQKLLSIGCVPVLAGMLVSQAHPRGQVGPLPDGSFLLNSGWRLSPAGKQIALDTFPMSMAISPDGKFLVVLNAGYNPPSLSVIDAASAQALGSTPVEDAWLGLTFAPKGDRVYVGGGAHASVFEFTFAAGKLQPARTFSIVAAGRRTPADFVGDVALSPDGRLLYAADLFHDSIAVLNPQSGMMIQRFKTGRRPYRILFHPDGKSLFVTHWGDGTLGQYDASSGALLSAVRIGAHPTDMIWREGPAQAVEGEPAWAARLFVAAANTNNVYTLGVTSGKLLSIVESINLSMTPRQPLGMTPSALALSPDGKHLYVACSGANAVAVVDMSEDRSRVEGFIPSGRYPTAVRALPSGTLVVLNGKGLRSYPNLTGPNAAAPREQSTGFLARMQTGTASWIAPFNNDQLASWTKTVLAGSAYCDARLDEANPLPPIEHVIYIVKEGRTYDQVLGDLKEGNGDPSLVLFGENVTPNHHKLAREFVLFDNFYVNGDVSADGNQWSAAAIASDYVEKLGPSNSARRRTLYDFEGQETAATPPAGYLWTNAASAGLTLRNFGYFVENKPDARPGAEQVARVNDPVLTRATNRFFRGCDLTYPDIERAKVFLSELNEYEKTGSMPRLIIMRLANDDASRAKAGAVSPLSSFADNDAALGAIVEGVSKSRFWPSTAIFVIEADAQDGPDHIDSHRSLAFIVSPFVKRHAVDSTFFNTTSVLRTMELLLGLRPMTHFDAGATPMAAAFQKIPDTTPYTAEKPRVPLAQHIGQGIPIFTASRASLSLAPNPQPPAPGRAPRLPASN